VCPECDAYAVAIEIHGPAQLRRIVEKVHGAVAGKILRSSRHIGANRSMQQPDFVELDLGKTLPDVMSYDFECRTCGQAFSLRCESYHGIGGSWQCG